MLYLKKGCNVKNIQYINSFNLRSRLDSCWCGRLWTHRKNYHSPRFYLFFCILQFRYLLVHANQHYMPEIIAMPLVLEVIRSYHIDINKILEKRMLTVANSQNVPVPSFHEFHSASNAWNMLEFISPTQLRWWEKWIEKAEVGAGLLIGRG